MSHKIDDSRKQFSSGTQEKGDHKGDVASTKKVDYSKKLFVFDFDMRFLDDVMEKLNKLVFDRFS